MPTTNPTYLKTYKISLLIRGLLIAVWGMVILPLACAALFSSPDPNQVPVEKGIPEPVVWSLVLFIAVSATLYGFRRRVVLFSDAFEIRGIFGNRRYLRSDIQGISNRGTIYFKNGKDTVQIPSDIHPDDNYVKWFDTLPKLGNQIFNPINDSLLATLAGTGSWKKDIDVVAATSEARNVTKRKAYGIVLLGIVFILALAIVLDIWFPKLSAILLGLLVFKKVIIPIIVFAAIAISSARRKG